MQSVEIAVRQPATFTVDGTDYLLEFPISAVIELEAKLGRGMKGPWDWFRIQTKEVPDILAAGFQRHNPDKAGEIAKAVCDNLSPEQIEVVIDGLCWAACPKAMKQLKEETEKAKARAKEGLRPNVQGVAVS